MDLSSIKSKLDSLQKKEKKEKKEKIDYTKYIWKPKSEGKYQIRFVPNKFNKEYPFKEVFIHYGYTKYPLYALTNWGEKDPIVEFAKELRKTNDKENWSLAKKLDPKMRVFAPVVVRGEEDKGVRWWEFGKEIYMQLLGIAEDEDYGDYTDINEGRDFTVEAVLADVGGRKNSIKCNLRIKPKTSQLSSNAKEIEKWLEEQTDILDIQIKHEFDKMKEILQNFLSPEEENEEVAEETEETDVENNTDGNITDLPWEDDSKKASKASNYTLNTSKSKKQKFEDLFEDNEE
jgi:hypothetical protein